MLRRDPVFLPRNAANTRLSTAKPRNRSFHKALKIPRPNPSLFQFEGGSEDQLLSGTAKSRGCTIAAERKSNDLGI
jgi:hypothetical protein